MLSVSDIDKHRTWVAKKENSAILYRDYQYLKLLQNVKNSRYKEYEQQIELDIPRSFPKSIWLKHPGSQYLVKQQLKMWCLYSPIGYYQGMLFILVPLCQRFQGLDHISFFAFVEIIKQLTFLNKDVMPNVKHKQKEEVLHVIRVLAQCCKKVKSYDVDDRLVLELTIEYQIMFTLALNRCGDTLANTDLILDYFLEVLHDEKKFKIRLKLFSFAMMLPILKSKLTEIELASLEFDRDALKAIIHCALSSGTLFKAFA